MAMSQIQSVNFEERSWAPENIEAYLRANNMKPLLVTIVNGFLCCKLFEQNRRRYYYHKQIDAEEPMHFIIQTPKELIRPHKFQSS